MSDPSKLEQLPVSYQALVDYLDKQQPAKLFSLRMETFSRIEKLTGVPLICYVAKTLHLPPGLPAHIDDGDITGFSDLVHSTPGEAVDVFVVSNGGSAEATERIVRLLRARFRTVRFIVPANAYSAATLMCFSGDAIIMDSSATLGPIDPQINGVPARAIRRAFESVEERLKTEGPKALTAYMPLLMKYDLHTLEVCRSAQELSDELAAKWLSTYMLKCPVDDPRVVEAKKFFSDYDTHKSHARSIDRELARTQSLEILNPEDTAGLADLVRSLYNQYEMWFDMTTFFKMFENPRGIHWGRRSQEVTFQFPLVPVPGTPQPVPQPGPPQKTT